MLVYITLGCQSQGLKFCGMFKNFPKKRLSTWALKMDSLDPDPYSPWSRLSSILHSDCTVGLDLVHCLTAQHAAKIWIEAMWWPLDPDRRSTSDPDPISHVESPYSFVQDKIPETKKFAKVSENWHL